MKILVENGCYHLRNMGDVAMLQVAVDRLTRLFPHAEISVLTDAPELLRRYVPQALPLAAAGRHAWFRDGVVLGGLYRFLPAAFVPVLHRFESRLKRSLPLLTLCLIRLREKLRGRDAESLETFIRSIAASDLLVVSGGGDLNDEFADYAVTLLDVLALARRFSTRAVLLGQGIGPMNNPQLVRRARQVLPKVERIFVRERLAAPRLLAALEVPFDRLCVTGDDAIGMANQAAQSNVGRGIGVNLRLASYSGIGRERLRVVQDALRRERVLFSASLLPLPISFHSSESDVASIRELLAGLDIDSDGGADLDTPAALVAQASRCRVVVTASYHAAVFALAQGIPAVCLAKSAYYIDKFRGLADQFGNGCQVLLFDDPQLEMQLQDAIENAWHDALALRPALLNAARRQAEVGKNACRSLGSFFKQSAKDGTPVRTSLRDKLQMEGK